MVRITKSTEERRSEIICTARELFFEKSYEKTTIADISSAMNVAQGLVYHYFSSKVDILYAVIDEVVTQNAANTEQNLLLYDGTALECLSLLLDKTANDQPYPHMIDSLLKDRGIREYFCKTITVHALPFTIKLIDRGTQDGSWDCPHPKEAASFILYGVVESFMNYEEDCEEETIEEKKSIYREIIYRILGINESQIHTQGST
jgi:AcrR family transcriptional regulator